MEALLLLAIPIPVIILIVWLITRRKKRNSNSGVYLIEEEDDDDFDHQAPASGYYDRTFTLAELRRAETGKYSWDDTGCVFEVNSDGTVTVVGHFDTDELMVDTDQEIHDRMIADDLPEMLPRIWSFLKQPDDDGNEQEFILQSDDGIFGINVAGHFNDAIEEIKGSEIIRIPSDGEISPILNSLIKSRSGTVILMPSNEMEFIMSLGAQACLKRLFEESVNVQITSPAVMGALWSAIKAGNCNSSRISFAFGEDNDYKCCNMTADNGIYMVYDLTSSSVIRQTDRTAALGSIARGAMVQSMKYSENSLNVTLIDLMTYPMTLMLTNDQGGTETYEFFERNHNTPTRQSVKGIHIAPDETMSFIVGSAILVDDIVAESAIHPAPDETIDVIVNFDFTTGLIVEVSSGDNRSKINIGDLIG